MTGEQSLAMTPSGARMSLLRMTGERTVEKSSSGTELSKQG